MKDLKTSACLNYSKKLKGKLFPSLLHYGTTLGTKEFFNVVGKGYTRWNSRKLEPPKIKWELQHILQKASGKLPRELVNSSCFHAFNQKMCSFQGDIRIKYPAYAKSSRVWLKYLYKHFHKWCHLDSSSMSWGGEAKRSSGRCYLKAFVELEVKEEENQAQKW